jgi:two-component system, NtrC family, sensor kinase
MSVRLKLVVMVLFVALVPISVSAWISLRIHQRAFERNLASLHEVAASQQAQRVGTRLKNLHDNIQRLANSTLPWNELSADERQAALWLIYRADEDVVAVMLLDGERRLLTQPAYLTEATVAEEPGHLPAPDAIVAAMLRHLPGQNPGTSDGGYGQPFLISADQDPIIPLSIPIPNPKQGQSNSTLGIGVSLRAVCKPGPRPEGIELLVVDSDRRSVCATRQFGPLTPMGAESGHQSESVPAVRTYPGRSGQLVLSAEAALPYGWQVVAEQPVATAYAASRSMRLQAILWILISVAIALTSGLILAQGISGPVKNLMRGVRELARGNLDHRFDLPEKDEFGRLGRAFNHMAAKLATRDAEIREWNSELQKRVQERTLAIEQYHEHLLQAEKSAVMARLTAGVAAEVNDPLTGILGAVQLLALRACANPERAEEARLFANAEAGAQRIRELIKRVQALGQRQPRSQLRPVTVQDLVASAAGPLGQALTAADIEVVRISPGAIPPVLGNFTQLEQALFQVLTNAVAACSTESRSDAHGAASGVDQNAKRPSRKHRILVQTKLVEGSMVLIAVSDDGVGIPKQDLENIFEPFVTLRANSGPGLGLTIARRIVEEHGGKLWAESNEVSGATLYMQLPTAESRTP